MKKNNGIWINIDCKKFYDDSKLNGLRLYFDKEVSLNLKNQIKNYINYLRKQYFFPIRCKVYFCYTDKFTSKKDKYCLGTFLTDENDKEIPEIFVPVLFKKKEEELYPIAYKLNVLLTYYFQWYFLQDKERSYRSLEIEATKYANYLCYSYFSID